MKQAELQRELGQLVKTEAKKNGWKSVGGMPYWTIRPLFFVMVPVVTAKEGFFHCTLRFKWLELDRALWRVLGMSSNEDAPFSLHANGAFTLSGREILTISTEGLIWGPGVLEREVENALRQAGQRAKEVAGQITSIHSYLEFIQREHEALIERHPRAAINIWTETVLVAMVSGDKATAAKIARAEIAAHRSGGFLRGDESFFQRALALCEA
jgi:hypothetical protein